MRHLVRYSMHGTYPMLPDLKHRTAFKVQSFILQDRIETSAQHVKVFYSTRLAMVIQAPCIARTMMCKVFRSVSPYRHRKHYESSTGGINFELYVLLTLSPQDRQILRNLLKFWAFSYQDLKSHVKPKSTWTIVCTTHVRIWNIYVGPRLKIFVFASHSHRTPCRCKSQDEKYIWGCHWRAECQQNCLCC